MKTYGEDLRERVVGSRARGNSATEVARFFGISKRSVERYWKQHKETGTIEPKQRGGYRRSRLAEHDDRLREWIKADPGLTLAEIRLKLSEQLGIELGTTALWHRLERLNLSFKKNAARRRARSA
ncbi:MAG TPA: IS630 transposase-related protein [Chthoniobacterales bacterium]